ncbi:uncharacterized protein LOC100901662 [Galendromus occidentalis]|uniref:Uncharacterized protein LOC100901662 n=1 Tax=Galendromus occidentalis TaxID=34638 RepID=A0AAJ6VUY6_9ACAR|nr:uncharacterized protein LOC100901662 [Galendromus occidentalis]
MNPHSIYDNSFFKFLQSRYLETFLEAQRAQWTILVPVEGTFRLCHVNSTFVGFHILKPSPLYADHFVCHRHLPATLVELDSERNVLHTTCGFPYPKHVCIVGEEIAYNENLQPYRILLICEPIHFPTPRRRSRAPHHAHSRQIRRGWSSELDPMNDSTDTPAPPSFEEAKAYLHSISVFSETLRVIEEKVEAFNKTYVIVPKFISDVVDRIRSIAETATQVLTSDSTSDPDKLAICVDNYVSGLAHHKVFNAVKSICGNDDADLERRLEFLRLSNVAPDMLGVQEECFHCELPISIVELASLNAKYTPVDKLWCIRRTLSSIQREVASHFVKCGADLEFGEDVPSLTAETLIPLVVVVLARSRPTSFSSNIFYIDHFCGVKDDFSSFTLSTFKAAVEFVGKYRGPELDHLSPRLLRKELSLVDLMEVTASINEGSAADSKSTAGSEDGYHSKAATRSNPVDSKLEQITRLIEKQTLDFHSKEEEHLRRLQEREPRASSSLNSSATSVDSNEEGSLLFSPLSTLRRSLRGQSKPN